MRSFFPNAKMWLGRHWRGLICTIIIVPIAVFTLSLQLNNLVPGYNQYENQTLISLESAPRPWFRAVNAPYITTAYWLGKLLNNQLYGARVTSVVFILLATACFFFIVKFWLKYKLAVIGSLLFLSTSWLLNISHQALPMSFMVFATCAVLASLIWTLQTKRFQSLAFFSFVVSTAIFAYAIYSPWIIIVSMIILLIRAKEQLVKLKTWQVFVAAGIYFLLLAPLFYSLAHHPGQIRELLGIPLQLPSITQYFNHLLGIIAAIAIYAKTMPELHLANLPTLDIFSTAMFLLGLYHFIRLLPKQRSILFLSCFAVLTLVIALSSDYQLNMILLLPLIYLSVTAGIAEMIKRWFTFFPRNPLARNIGIGLIVLAIGFSSYYQMRTYFIAWPNSSATKAAYMVKFKE